MILAEKIMKLRKENGWSQEDLASKLGISRQSVSKWESTASIPDLDKIIKLSELFHVSTDYLLKDELDEDPGLIKLEDQPDEAHEHIRKVSLTEVNTYMDTMLQTAKWIALGVSICILSPICLILFTGLSEYHFISWNEDQAAGVGLIILFLLAAIAVSLFILNGLKLSPYEYLQKESIVLEYGATGLVQSKKEHFYNRFKKAITVGVVLCICSVIPYFLAIAWDASDIIYLFCTCILLVIVSFACYLFVFFGMIYDSFQKLLEEGDYVREKKIMAKKNEAISSIYWGTVVVIYLGYSLITMNWQKSWIIWPCAGVFYWVSLLFAGLIQHCTDTK